MAVMNWLPRGSGDGDTGNKMNIFVQPTEPHIKEGIWIETDKSFIDILITEPITDDYDYTKMNNLPYTFTSGSTSTVDTDIYLFGGGTTTTTRKNCYKYNTTSNTYTKMLDIPYEFYYGSTSVVGNDVYLFGGNGGVTNCYKYNTTSNTYTKMIDIPYVFYNGSTSVVGNDVYIFGGSGSGGGTNCYAFASSVSFNNNTLIIIKTSEHDGLYKTQFFQPPEDINPDYMGRIVSGFDDALLYADNTIQDSLPTYYGNGTEWIKFKN